MYTDDDLSAAAKAGIFTDESIVTFRTFMANGQQTTSTTALVDEENFRLISGFNDFFVVFACFLLLGSVTWLASGVSGIAAGLAVAATSWGLTEFFVRRRKLALPGIVLLMTFMAGIAWVAGYLYLSITKAPFSAVLVAGIAAAMAAWVHWLRFHVPITVALGVAALIAGVIAALTYQAPELRQWADVLFVIGGLTTFGLAMFWDVQDRVRKTGKTDVAFWLHLLAAPLIVHPIFSQLGVLAGESSTLAGMIVFVLYIGLAVVSMAIDRRALMVSALVYVLFSFSTLLRTNGFVSSGFAITGVCIGSLLLMLSAYWHVARGALLQYLPQDIVKWLPPQKA
jgi:hypothetical protein